MSVTLALAAIGLWQMARTFGNVLNTTVDAGRQFTGLDELCGALALVLGAASVVVMGSALLSVAT